MKRLFNIFILLTLLLTGTPSLAVHAAGNTPALPISKLLNTDGTLNLTTGYSGTVDADNYSVHLDPAHGPVFSPLMTVNAWSSLGSGLNNIVYAIAVNGSNVYMGGQFTDAGGDANADRIAKWNGSSWSALGSGLPNGQVNALAFNGSVLYVGGSFTNAGGVSGANYIAQWNGSSWSTLGDGVGNAVNAIGVSGLNIYIAGNFINAGVDVNADYIAKLDGGTWAALGATPLTGPVNTIAVAGSFVYAGGDFINVGGNPDIDRIALWDGTSWSPLGTGLGATVASIALSSGDVYAGGLFNDAGGVSNADKIAKWDGTAWSALGSGLNSFVNNVVISGSNIYAGGNFLNAGGDANADKIAKWDGSAWSALGTAPLDNTVSAIAINELDVYVGGIFNDAGGDSNGDKIALFQIDATAPTVASFTATSPSTSLNVPITAFTASDNISVTGYQITQSSTPPTASASGWTASAPTTYTVAGSGSYLLYPWVKDATGNVSAVYGSPASVTVDATKPTVDSFSAPSPSTSLTISITAFTASDNVSVTGYQITQSSTPPTASASGWTATAPTTYTVAGSASYTLHPWVKDATGNVSALYGSPASVTVDAIKPTVDSFSALSLSNSRDVPITAFSASDDIYLTGYMITESSTAPTAGDSGWSDTAATTYTVGADGNYILYPWAKDALGNVSAVYGSPSSIIVDAVAPTISSFTLLSSSNSLDISIAAFTASDSVGVIGYLITASSTAPTAADAGWSDTAPTTYTVGAAGNYILNPWAKDALGNVSAVYGSPASVEVNTGSPSDTTAPSVDTFTTVSTSNSLDISITNITASDNTAVTGYLITESDAQPASNASGWSGSAPTTYIVASDGSYTLYPWAKDAAGNVSAEFGSPASVDVDTPLTVTNTNDSGPGSLRSILTSATSGDTVIFDSAISGQTIYLASTLTISNNLTIDGSALDPQITISGDSDNDGTGDVQVFSFSSGATVTLNSLTITKGSNSTAAGIFNASGATLTITNSTLTDNATTGGPGGGIRNDGTLTVTTSTFSYNSAFGGSGGGIRNIGTLTVANSTFSNNTTTGSGGGIYNVSGFVSLTITNSTFSGNSAASQGGGIYYSGGVLNYANTMIANSVSGGDCAGDGTINTNTNNLVEDGSCSAALNGDPNLGPLADNGGSTQTIALLPGSTAIDAGDDSVCATAPVNSTSQNGVTRPVGAHCDIGSFEYVDTIAPTVTSIVRAGGSTTSATSVSFLVTFSEDVTGVDSIANDFSLTTTGSVSGAAVTGLSGSGSIYTITVSTGTGTGTIRLDVPISASITDSAANSLDGLPFISGPAYSILKPPAPKAPVLRSPRNNIVTNNRMPTLWWTSVKGGVTYEVEVATDNSFAIIMDTDVVSGLSRTVAVPLGDDEYFWRVRASNASNQPGAWSSIRTFTIDTTGPIAPTLISPTDNASSNRTPSFKWLSVPTAVLYELQYDNDSDFSSPYDVTTRGTFRKPPAMKPGTYYWRVRAKDASGNWGNWSAPFIITITNP